MTIEELKTELEGINQRIQTNQADIERVTERLSKARSQHAAGADEFDAMRKERQEILAAEGDPKAITATIKKHKEKQEMLEDEIAGLEERLAALTEQDPALEKERLILEQNILIEERIRPYVDKYNILAHNMRTILTQLEKDIFTYGMLKSDPNQPPAVISSPVRGSRSGWNDSALSSIPSLVVNGDKPQPQIYDRTTVINEIKSAYAARHIREQDIKNLAANAEWDKEEAALEEKHKGIRCFQCHKYTGLKPVEGERVLACIKFEQGIPGEILSGVNTSAC